MFHTIELKKKRQENWNRINRKGKEKKTWRHQKKAIFNDDYFEIDVDFLFFSCIFSAFKKKNIWPRVIKDMLERSQSTYDTHTRPKKFSSNRNVHREREHREKNNKINPMKKVYSHSSLNFSKNLFPFPIHCSV